MKLWKSKKNNNTNSNPTISCVPGKSSTLVKNNDAKTDVATTSSTNVSGKLMKIYRTTDGFVTVVLTNKSFKKKRRNIFLWSMALSWKPKKRPYGITISIFECFNFQFIESTDWLNCGFSIEWEPIENKKKTNIVVNSIVEKDKINWIMSAVYMENGNKYA